MFRCCYETAAAGTAREQYERAKQNVMQAALSASRLSADEQRRLAHELLGAESVLLLLHCLEGSAQSAVGAK